MKSKLPVVLIIAVIAVVCLLGWRSSAQTSNKVVWEYKVYSTNSTLIPTAADISQFNKMGAEGWEYIESRSEEPTFGMPSQRRIDYLFKRMK